jgi:hypothetical protein
VSNLVPNLAAAITADGFALLLQQTPTATVAQLVGTAYEGWQKKRAKESYDIFLSELAKGRQLSNEVDPNTFFGLLHRYLNATKQGAARRNLHLMAQVLTGSLERDCPFTPDKLASFADLVAGLTRDEIKFLAVFWSAHNDSTKGLRENVDQSIQGEESVEVNTQRIALEKLVPNICGTKLEFSALGGSLTRTGLIVAQSVYGGTRFDITLRLSELVLLVDLENEHSS